MNIFKQTKQYTSVTRIFLFSIGILLSCSVFAVKPETPNLPEAVEQNTAAIGANATNIGNNTTAIGTNATNIGNNTTAIGTNATNIGNNTTAIGTNATNIGNNTTAIGTNATNIGNNTTAIGTNATNIGNNTTAIGTNVTNIGNNTTAITELQDALPAIPEVHTQPLVLTLCPDSDSPQWGSCEITYELGDLGPAGGFVFYVTDDGLHGLEAAPVDQGSAEWGCFGTHINGADGLAINTGAPNTVDILDGCNEAGIAARLAFDYEHGGFRDWFLPSKDELNSMWENLADSDGDGINSGPDDPNNLGGFASDSYWSSSEYDSDYAWGQYFYGGDQLSYGKNDTFRVRAVRAF